MKKITLELTQEQADIIATSIAFYELDIRKRFNYDLSKDENYNFICTQLYEGYDPFKSYEPWLNRC